MGIRAACSIRFVPCQRPRGVHVDDKDFTLGPDHLARLQLFGGLPDDVLRAVATRCRVRRFGAGEHVLHHEDRSDELFFVLSGRVRVLLYAPSGRDVSFRDLLAGDVFGELAALDGGPRSASVVASVESTLAVMSRQAFRDLIARHPDVNESLLRHLVALIRRYSQRVYELSTLGVDTRIRLHLLRLAAEASHDGTRAVLSPAPTLADLASRVSTTREAVSREVARMSREGLVERRGNDLVVNDIGALGDTVDGALE